MVVPFTDGHKTINIVVPLEKSYQSKGKELVKIFEQSIILSFIDHHWKEHLRQMDDMKQSVQLAVHEQKDPLVIYKLEAYELFKQMLGEVNRDVTGFLMKGSLPVQDPNQIRQHREQRRVAEKVKESRGDEAMGNEMQGAQTNTQAEKPQPVRVEQKIGRNDPCPCGSGKKFKHCHGKEA